MKFLGFQIGVAIASKRKLKIVELVDWLIRKAGETETWN